MMIQLVTSRKNEKSNAYQGTKFNYLCGRHINGGRKSSMETDCIPPAVMTVPSFQRLGQSSKNSLDGKGAR